ncbi:MAG: CHAT domain-containing protein [Aphanocapsa sp. GSE-SYN-MK-11-07L]|jgi:CHAT domain-containing protein|nr:CHAT domain-containing protein [Aphanocapsa sp. GSE-SYN-MK-11-07L]
MKLGRNWISGLLGLLLGLGLTVVPLHSQPGVAQTSENPLQLLQQGRDRYQAGKFTQAVTLWQQAATRFQAEDDRLHQAMALSNLSLAQQQLGEWSEAKAAIASSLDLLQPAAPEAAPVLAQALNTQGSLNLALNQPEAALKSWQQAAAAYAQAKDQTGQIRSQINQVQALRALGLYRQAISVLTQVQQDLQNQPASLTQAAGLLSLGNTLRLVGNLEQSQQILEKSLTIAQQLQAAPDTSAALLSLGNTAWARRDIDAAYSFYQQATAASPNSLTGTEAQINQLSLLLQAEQWAPAQKLWPQIQVALSSLPVSRASISAQINFSQSLIQFKQTQNPPSPTWTEIAQKLAGAAEQAKTLGDRRSQAYALGTLGEVYETNRQWADATQLTQQALLLSQSISAADITYRWQWQLGRIFKAQQDPAGAIASYGEAVKTLQTLRSDLAGINPDVQFSFRDSVEPVYRQLVDLLLQPEGGTDVSQARLVQARSVIESLQVAEIENFLRSACLEAKPKQVDQIDPTAAVIYPIVLPDRLEVIVSLPQQPLRHYASPVGEVEVNRAATQLKRELQTPRGRPLALSQTVYNWLIRPLEADLQAAKVQTLVFVPDGTLRNIPMAALNDGQSYLAQQYNLAITPGLLLLDSRPLLATKLEVITAGLTEARQGFSPLPNVSQELAQIKSEVPTAQLLDKDFTSAALQKEIRAIPFPVVHLATHGQFSSDPDQTFILTWDDRIGVNQLNTLLQTRNTTSATPIELLILSACQTAAGDSRAALGLAGMAIRAGARSTLASLWSVDDAATAILMGEFYQELVKADLTKSEALRRAQESLIRDPRYSSPYYWAGFILVGNWR